MLLKNSATKRQLSPMYKFAEFFLANRSTTDLCILLRYLVALSRSHINSEFV